jgi:D-amino-acid dehydrogenase
MPESKSVAVIGAGIIGLTTAYSLVNQGHRVTVLDEQRYSASKCSFANGGQLSVSNSEVWTTWANVGKGIKWLFKKDAPLYIKPSFEWQKISWLAKFLLQTAKGAYESNTKTTIKLGLEAREIYKTIVAEEGIEFDHTDCGILHFYKDRKYATAGADSALLYSTTDCEWKSIGSRQLRDVEPTLSNKEFKALYWTPEDSTGDIHKFCQQLTNILRDKYGVSFIMETRIDNLRHVANSYDAVVVSAGVGSRKIAKSIGDSLPIYPVKGYSITINDCDPDLLPKVSIIDDQAKIVTATLGNRLRVAGTAELAGENYDITRSRIEPLLAWVKENFPGLDCSNYSQWACLRPMTPSMMPIVEQSKRNPKVFYNTGHGHLGWTLGPATAKQVADLVSRS